MIHNDSFVINEAVKAQFHRNINFLHKHDANLQIVFSHIIILFWFWGKEPAELTEKITGLWHLLITLHTVYSYLNIIFVSLFWE